eukprot:TRINITY_DN92101_c0_g1_i1.p1 TRINITY_DN92101_c0_g1~~TRINITY_DN92101_c0_g1_i1.p1  ORF type:complete len:161 (-),score=79.02 TRINITY_DN92101_c0_g1_i1:39-521(-)
MHQQKSSPKVSLLTDYNTGKHYTIVYNLTDNTATCKTTAITGKLEVPCISRRAHHRGQVTLGGTLEAENWIEEVTDDKGRRVHVDILIAKNVNVPIRVYDRTHSGREAITEFWNFKLETHSEDFIVPSFCNSNVDDNSVISARQAVGKLHRLARSSPLFK